MVDRNKGRRGPPQVEIIKKSTPPGVKQSSPLPKAPPTPSSAAKPSPATPAPRGRAPFRSARPPPAPPTEEQVLALARRERVPYRIARGELLGKMKARIWRKLHAEEAHRFDQAYELVRQTPNLELADAFAMVQSGMTLEQLLARKARTQKKTQVKQARTLVRGDQIEQFLTHLVEHQTELSVVLGERAFLDVLTKEEPIALWFQKSGRLEKLQLVVLSPRPTWEEVSTGMERDPKLAQKPAAVSRQPEQRAVVDPRPFLELVGAPLELLLRNGVRLQKPLLAAGPFDLLLGQPGSEILVPLHAILRWKKVPS